MRRQSMSKWLLRQQPYYPALLTLNTQRGSTTNIRYKSRHVYEYIVSKRSRYLACYLTMNNLNIHVTATINSFEFIPALTIMAFVYTFITLLFNLSASIYHPPFLSRHPRIPQFLPTYILSVCLSVCLSLSLSFSLSLSLSLSLHTHTEYIHSRCITHCH